MSTRFLIIHESAVIKDIVRKYVMTNYNDAVTESSVSMEDISKRLEEKRYDIILSGLEMTGMNGIDIFDRICLSDINQKTPFIIMTSSDNLAQRERLSNEGIEYILPIPFTPVQFKKLTGVFLNEETDKPPVVSGTDALKTDASETDAPEADASGTDVSGTDASETDAPETDALEADASVSKTSEELNRIPKIRAIIKSENQKIPTEVIQISTDSIVCELVCSEEPAFLKQACQITLQFPVDYDKALKIHTTGELAELTNKIRFMDKSSQRLRLTWQIIWGSFDLTVAAEKILKLFLKDSPVQDSDLGTNDSVTDANKTLRAEIETLNDEKQKLSRQVSQLEKKISETQKSEESIKDVSLDALINEVVERSDDPAKISIFKRIIEDNVKLRE